MLLRLRLLVHKDRKDPRGLAVLLVPRAQPEQLARLVQPALKVTLVKLVQPDLLALSAQPDRRAQKAMLVIRDQPGHKEYKEFKVYPVNRDCPELRDLSVRQDQLEQQAHKD